MSDSVGGVAEQEPDPRIEAMIRHDMDNSLSVTLWTFEEWRDKRPRAYAIMAADTERLLAAADAVDPVRAELRAVRADLLTTRRQLEAVNQQAESLGGPVGQMVKFAAKHGQLQRDLKCDDCSAGDHYHCAHGQPSYPRCCCPERLDLNQ